MFTGIVTGVGKIHSCVRKSGDYKVVVTSQQLDMSDVAIGDSIAVNGVCLTVVTFDEHSFTADVSAETASLTAKKQWNVGTPVNLEKALTPTTRLGGHMVTGHVDGCANIIERRQVGGSTFIKLMLPEPLAHYVAKKGSVALDGISLTVNTVEALCFSVNIVPHTWGFTTIAEWVVGYEVNIEVDIIARYLERLMARGQASGDGIDSGDAAVAGLTEEKLIEHGFGRR